MDTSHHSEGRTEVLLTFMIASRRAGSRVLLKMSQSKMIEVSIEHFGKAKGILWQGLKTREVLKPMPSSTAWETL